MARIFLMGMLLLLASCKQYNLSVGGSMERIGIAPDQHGFVCIPSGRPFRPWGNNYGNHGGLLEDFWASDWRTVEEDFHEMKLMGANVVRVHLQFGKFMLKPDRLDADSLNRLGRLLELAERTGLHLDLTGLACYRQSGVPAWYDQLSEAARWKAQARFWEGIAAECAHSPAVFCYDLINEPVVATEKRKAGDWYTGALGGYNFVQFINLEPAGRSMEQIALPWIDEMKQAIRKHDRRHLITAGLLPFNPGRRILEQFDFVSVHIYPEAGKTGQAMTTLRQFAIGRPVVIEETFPLSCSAAELKIFLLDSRQYACGWIGHYNGESCAELEALEKSGKITLQQSIWLVWQRLFQQMGPAMSAAGPCPK